MRLENNIENYYSTKTCYDTNNIFNGLELFDPVYTMDIKNLPTSAIQNYPYFSKVYVSEVSAWCISATNPTSSTRYCNIYFDISKFSGCLLNLYANYKITSGTTPLSIDHKFYTTSATSYGYIKSATSGEFTDFYNNAVYYFPEGVQYDYIQIGITSGGTALIKNVQMIYATKKNQYVVDNTLTPVTNYFGNVARGGNISNVIGLSGFDVDLSQFKMLKDNYNLNVIRWQIVPLNRDSVQFDYYDWEKAQEWLNVKIDQLKKVLSYCAQNKIKVIIDMHVRFGFDTINGKGKFLIDSDIREKNIEMWRRVASAIKGHPAIFAYGIINEPATNQNTIGISAEYQDTRFDMSVNEYQELCCREILKIDPTARFSLTCTRLSNAFGFTSIKPSKYPAVYELHNYFTGRYTVSDWGVSADYYPGYYDSQYRKYVNKTTMKEFLQPVRDFQLAHNVPIYVGEFGVVRWAQNAAQWVKECIEIFEEWGWNYTAFEFLSYAHIFVPWYDPGTYKDDVYAPLASARPTAIEYEYIKGISASNSLYSYEENIPYPINGISATKTSTGKIRFGWDDANYPLSAYNFNIYKPEYGWQTIKTSANSLLVSATINTILSANVTSTNEFGTASGNVISDKPIVVYPLDNISSKPYRALSVRKLTSAYNGPLLNIYRTDGANLDIYADNTGIVDLSAINNFLSATSTSGYVRTWYDQSPNSAHVSATQLSRRAYIGSNGGNLIYNGNILGALFDGTKGYFGTSGVSAYTSATTSIAAFKSLSAQAQQTTLWCEMSAGTPSTIYAPMVVSTDLTKIKAHIVSNDGTVLITNSTTSGPIAINQQTNIVSVQDDFTTITTKVNGNKYSKNTVSYIASRAAHPIDLSQNGYFSFGAKTSPSTYNTGINAIVSELIVFDKHIPDNELELLENNLLDSYKN